MSGMEDSMRRLLAMLVAVLTLVGCCKSKVEAPAGGEVATTKPSDGEENLTVKATKFLAQYNEEYFAKDKANNLAYWKAANSGKAEDFDGYAATELALKTFHSDTKRYETLIDLLAERDKLSPLLQRSLDVALLAFKGNQLPKEVLKDLVDRGTEIEKTFNTFRPTLDSKKMTNNDLLESISKETDSEKRQAMWLALKQVGEAVGPQLVELARKRNEAAVILGFKNFWDMQIRLQEHDPETLATLLDELAKATDEPFRKMKAELDAELARRFGVAPEDMRPWHYDNPFFQQAPPSEVVKLDTFYNHMKKEDIVALGAKFFKSIGLEGDDLIAASDFYEREGKDQHAFCISIDREGDVRMLLNVKPTAEWMDTMNHETGHAVYDKYIDRELPFNLRDAAHILTTEGIAMLLGALAKNPTWLVGYVGADSEEVSVLTPALLKQRQREQLIFARWTMVMFNFEKALYEDPDQDLNTLWYDLVERFQLLKRPAGRNASDWAAKPHFTIAPVYYHNYVLGELFAAQLRDALAKHLGHKGPTSTIDFVDRKEIGAFLIEKVFKPGRSIPWPKFVEDATGKELGIDAYIAEVK
jgi:peptidyl-dipeptidase A